MILLERCPWYVAGPLLGLVIVGLRAAVNKPLGALGGYIDLVERLGRSRQLGFGTCVLGGIVLGGGLFAFVTGNVAKSPTFDVSSISQGGLLLLAGVLIGGGARTAGGCTSGHGLCGVCLGSTASLVATVTFFAVAVALAHILAWAAGGAL